MLFLVSCLLRYFLEVFSNLILSSFREQTNWERYWKDSSCSSEAEKGKFICRALNLCLQEVVPELIPVSADDVWIQILLIVIILLVVDRFEAEGVRKVD